MARFSWRAQVKRAWKRILDQREIIARNLSAHELLVAQDIVKRFGTGGNPVHKQRIKSWTLEYSYPDVLEVAGGDQEYSRGVIEYVNLSVDLLTIWQGDGRNL